MGFVVIMYIYFTAGKKLILKASLLKADSRNQSWDGFCRQDSRSALSLPSGTLSLAADRSVAKSRYGTLSRPAQKK